MTTEEETEIIEKAKILFPIGTRVVSVGGNMDVAVKHHALYFHVSYLRVDMDCALYDVRTKRWATVLAYPDTIINNYQIY